MSGYGKWISAPPYGADGIKRWQFVRHTPSTPDGFRELAAEFIAWADEHDMVTITLPRKTVVFNAGPHGEPWLRDACRKALGMEP